MDKFQNKLPKVKWLKGDPKWVLYLLTLTVLGICGLFTEYWKGFIALNCIMTLFWVIYFRKL